MCLEIVSFFVFRQHFDDIVVVKELCDIRGRLAVVVSLDGVRATR